MRGYLTLPSLALATTVRTMPSSDSRTLFPYLTTILWRPCQVCSFCIFYMLTLVHWLILVTVVAFVLLHMPRVIPFGNQDHGWGETPSAMIRSTFNARLYLGWFRVIR